MKKSSDSGVSFEQEPRKNVLLREINKEDLLENILFTNVFQLIPIGIMGFIQIVSVYKFDLGDYISNLLVYVIISCAASLYDILGKKNLLHTKTATISVIFFLITILCFTSTFYCLVLLCSVSSDFYNKEEIMLSFSIIFTLLAFLISFFKIARKEK